MRAFLLFWAVPLGFFWTWYALSYHDLHFGIVFFSRQVHDITFGVYAELLGVEPSAIAPMIAKAILLDTAIVLAVIAFRRRRRIGAWLRERGGPSGALAAQGGQPVERALQDEGGGGRIDALGALGAGDIGGDQHPFGRHG